MSACVCVHVCVCVCECMCVCMDMWRCTIHCFIQLINCLVCMVCVCVRVTSSHLNDITGRCVSSSEEVSHLVLSVHKVYPLSTYSLERRVVGGGRDERGRGWWGKGWWGEVGEG